MSKKPETSLEAYRSLKPDKIQQIYTDIIRALSVIGEGTFEDIASWLKIDKSRVWKRLSEMQKLGMIYNTGRKKLLKSNRNGFTWMLTNGTTPKTQEQANVFNKGTKSATDYAKTLLSNQTELFT